MLSNWWMDTLPLPEDQQLLCFFRLALVLTGKNLFLSVDENIDFYK
jgi:hypothetical protein